MAGERVATGTYRAIQAVNWSTAKNMIYDRDRQTKRLILSPLHYRAALDGVSPDSDAKRIGRAYHCATLEPDTFAARFVAYRASKTQGEGARKAWEAFKAAETTRTILSGADYDAAIDAGRAMRSSAERNPEIARLLSEGQAEVTRQWKDAESGLLCKARLDWIHAPMVIVDVKTDGRTIDPSRFAAKAEDYFYWHQMAFYRRAQAAAVGCSVDAITVYILALESAPPHAAVLCDMNTDDLAAADAEVGEVLAKIAQCREAGAWPGPFAQTVELRRPAWIYPFDSENPTEFEAEEV